MQHKQPHRFDVIKPSFYLRNIRNLRNISNISNICEGEAAFTVYFVCRLFFPPHFFTGIVPQCFENKHVLISVVGGFLAEWWRLFCWDLTFAWLPWVNNCLHQSQPAAPPAPHLLWAGWLYRERWNQKAVVDVKVARRSLPWPQHIDYQACVNAFSPMLMCRRSTFTIGVMERIHGYCKNVWNSWLAEGKQSLQCCRKCPYVWSFCLGLGLEM